MKDARIRTQFGQVSISFETTDQLKASLKDLSEQVNLIQQEVGNIVPLRPRLPKPGYENAYRFLPNGDLELHHRPKNNNVLVALVLFAYAPELLTPGEIERFSGIPNVSSLVLSQKQFSNYFLKIDEKWRLLPDGFELVEKKVKPVIATTPESREDDSQD